MDALETVHLDFLSDGTPFSRRYNDVYHSVSGGPAQARQVFLAGNGLPERWQRREKFTILETGFGLGINFLSTWQAWRQDPLACEFLHYFSLEKYPCTAAVLGQIYGNLPEFAEIAGFLLARWPECCQGEQQILLEQGRLVLTLVFGDATDCLPRFELAADALYLDGFSPDKNPELWSPWFCGVLAEKAVFGATLATWSVAGSVRRALQEAGFFVERCPGFGRKRQILTGVKPWRKYTTTSVELSYNPAERYDLEGKGNRCPLGFA